MTKSKSKIIVKNSTIPLKEPKKQNENVRIELHNAILNGRTKKAIAAINSGIDINKKDKLGVTALMYAAQYGRRDIFKALLDKGARFNGRSHKGHTTLINAAYGGNIKIVKMLIKIGVDLNEKSDIGASAYAYAEYLGHKDIITALIDAGARTENLAIMLENITEYFSKITNRPMPVTNSDREALKTCILRPGNN